MNMLSVSVKNRPNLLYYLTYQVNVMIFLTAINLIKKSQSFDRDFFDDSFCINY